MPGCRSILNNLYPNYLGTLNLVTEVNFKKLYKNNQKKWKYHICKCTKEKIIEEMSELKRDLLLR